MAKKKGGGPSIGLILTLIFFVLATFIAGTVAYFGYSEQEQFKADAKKAQDAQKTAEGQYREERVRKVMLRIALGVEDPADRVLLVQELEPQRVHIKDEYDKMKRGIIGKVPEVPDPKDKAAKPVSAFNWPLLSMTSKEIQTKTEGGFDADTAKADPDVAPALTIPAMIGIYIAKAEQAVKAKEDAITAKDNAEKLLKAKQVDKDAIEKRSRMLWPRSRASWRRNTRTWMTPSRLWLTSTRTTARPRRRPPRHSATPRIFSRPIWTK